MSSILGSTQLVIDKPLRFKFIRIWIAFFVEMNSKPTDHNDCVFRDKVAFIFVVFSDHMEHTGFSDWSVAHDFFDDGADVREIVFVLPCWGSLSSDYSVKFFVCPCNDFGVEGKL
jgi:hypothetical protein